MKAIVYRVLSTLGAILVVVSPTYSQQIENARPLGDVAREQQQARKQKGKTGGTVYTDIAVDPNKAEPNQEKANTEPSSGATEPSKSAPAAAKSQESGHPLNRAHRSVFDQTKSNKPDFLIVPAGTEIRVDIVDGKVIVPVRVGFATPIPALSRAEVTINRKYYAPYNISYDASGNYPGTYTENAELISVTVGAVAYPVKATVVPLNGSAAQPTMASIPSTRDITFVLTAPLAIRR